MVLPQTTAAAIRATLDRRRKALKAAPLASVILAADAAISDQQIAQLQRAMLPIPVLVYTDTRDAFAQAGGCAKGCLAGAGARSETAGLRSIGRGMERRRFLGGAMLAASGLGARRPAQARTDQPARRLRLRFAITFTNPLPRTLERQLFWCYLPANLPPAQALREVQVSYAHAVKTDLLGHRMLALEFDRFPALAQKVVTVTADVELGADRGSGMTGPALELAGRDAWLGPERFIESDAAEIRALATQLRGPTPLATMRWRGQAAFQRA